MLCLKLLSCVFWIVILLSTTFLSALEKQPDVYPCEALVGNLSPNSLDNNSNIKLPQHPLTSTNFIYTRGFNGRPNGHKGIDLATPPSNPIVAVWDGVITTIKWDNNIIGKDEEGGVGFGYYMIISNHQGNYSFYGHLLPNSVPFKEGAEVLSGMVIGLTGNSGRSSGPHLHYAEKNLVDEWVDPVWVIQVAHEKQFQHYPHKTPKFLHRNIKRQYHQYCKAIGMGSVQSKWSKNSPKKIESIKPVDDVYKEKPTYPNQKKNSNVKKIKDDFLLNGFDNSTKNNSRLWRSGDVYDQE